MSHTYAGVDSFPTGGITLPDDGDPNTAANLNTGPEGNRDAALFLYRRLGGGSTLDFFSNSVGSSTYTVPSGVRALLICAAGGGGGGGAGGSGDNTTNSYPTGGGGGGAAIMSSVVVDVTPGQVLTVTVGGGGIGGNSPGANGADGAPVEITDGASFDVFFTGGGGGKGGVTGDTSLDSNATHYLSFGGSPAGQIARDYVSNNNGSAAQIFFTKQPGEGGTSGTNLSGTSSNKLGTRAPFTQGVATGGAGGNNGTDGGSYRGGGGGGGGGLGPGGGNSLPGGGNGGAAGNGNNGGAGGNGSNGANAPAGSSGGGGGGGAGGSGSGGGGTPGSGGTGGNGFCRIIALRVV